MATIKLTFDNNYNVSQPTIVLATRFGDKIGVINTADEIVVDDHMNDASEFSLTVYKELDGMQCAIWDEIQSLRLAWVKDWDRWFEISVNLEDSDTIHKPITATSLGAAELSQIYVNSTEINTESDITREDYTKPTVLYDPDSPEASLLHRVMGKAPHYTIAHVDASIAGIQRTFSWDGDSIYDVFADIAEEIGCIFVFPDGSREDGLPARTVEVYDLRRGCLECGHRFETDGVCPKCGGENIKEGYGNDTRIFVSSDVLADSITLDVDEGSRKTCMKLEAGDDLMTAAVIACNPNGSQYLWKLTEADLRDMSDELRNKIVAYNALYDEYYTTREFILDGDLVARYNNLVSQYSRDNSHPQLTTSFIGFPALLEAYYNVIDFGLFLSDGMVPGAETPETTAAEQILLCTEENLSPLALSSVSSSTSQYTAESAIKAAVRMLLASHYDITLTAASFTNEYPDSDIKWVGTVTLTNDADADDTATSEQLAIVINNDYESYIKQSLNRVLSDASTEEVGITALFEMEPADFQTALSYYSQAELESLLNISKSCTDILITQGAAAADSVAHSLYTDYYDKQGLIQTELDLRTSEVQFVEEEVKVCIELLQDMVHDDLNFEEYIGSDLWVELSAFRREDTYQNDNFISDGLTNTELIERAKEFIELATYELNKAAVLQNSISASLHNLLAIREFAPLVDSFQVGNWIRVRVDDTVYKLRLIGYSIQFSSVQELEVEFSEATMCSSGMTDVKSVLDQMRSIATSYSYTQRQASDGAAASSIWNTMLDRGLSMTQMRILNDASTQEQVMDNHGILLRSYDPFSNSYSDEQMRIVSSTIAITDDNWKTVKTAVGKFYYADPDTGEMTSAYGINGEVIAGKLLLGNNLGIYNESGSLKFTNDGLVINILADEEGNYATPFRIIKDGDAEDGGDDVFTIDSSGNIIFAPLVSAEENMRADFAASLARTESGLAVTLESYVTNETFAGYQEAVTDDIATAKDEVSSDLTGYVNGELSPYRQTFEFTESGLIISNANKSIDLVLDEDKISFRKNGAVISSWTPDNFLVGNIVVGLNERAQFGNFVWRPREDESLTFSMTQ